MTQAAKFIDITRSYIPVDPNSFPQSLNGSVEGDSPENRIPVMAYKGYNFLPTSYGYKSYFGTNSKLGIDELNDRIDSVFIFQNTSYSNILVALGEKGVWIKKGEEAGAWTNAVPMSPALSSDQHFEWTYCIIANILYAYRQGQPSYQQIVSSVANGVDITSEVPNFLNMEAQAGVFNAAGRLAFWDSDDSVSWANQDDTSDFVPSLETLAGNMKFVDVRGRIVTIKAHGQGFIIYCTKSIVFIGKDTSGLYQWQPIVILPNAGISYPRQCVEGSPDTTHFAYTSEGMKKITNAKEETIIPEVTDFYQKYDKPVYLKIMQGRYLAFETLDEKYITGEVQITEEVVPEVKYTFPGVNIDFPDIVPKTQAAQCLTIAALDDGVPEGMDKPAPPEDQHPTNKLMQPVWVAHLSQHGVVDTGNIVWTSIPCATVAPDGVEKNHCPTGNELGKMTSDSTNKKTSGPEAWIDGSGWTISRFVSVQNAIWDAEEKELSAFVQAATNRNSSGSAEGGSAVEAPPPTTSVECTIGRYVTSYKRSGFGYSKCQFWLTRFATEAMDLVRVKGNSYSVSDGRKAAIPDGFFTYFSVGTPGLSFAEAAKLWADGVPYDVGTWGDAGSAGESGGPYPGVPSWSTQYTAVRDFAAPPYGRHGVYQRYRADPGYVVDHVDASGATQIPAGGRWLVKNTMSAYNKGVDVVITPTPESPYCELVGWSYTKVDGTKGIIPSATPCVAPTVYPADSGTSKAGGPWIPAPAGKDGSYCGAPYTPPVIDGISINWPSTEVVLPPGSFLLQKGSIAPVYPTFSGALVFDLHLKKWGKMKLRYKQLLDYSPVNSTVTKNVPFSAFGILAGALTADGKISIFDQYPTDSYISYGKIGYYRLGVTQPEETRVDFTVPSTGYIKLEASLEGGALSSGLTQSENFTNATSHTMYGGYPGKWMNIEIGGIFDISYLEFTGTTKGRR
ncbi:putative structural protein [Polaromonas phage Tiera]|nr:putative structural protein [Polaromonas phage Tiera]